MEIEPRKKVASKYVMSEEAARRAIDPAGFLRCQVDAMVGEIGRLEGIEHTLDGAYEVRIEVVPLDRRPEEER